MSPALLVDTSAIYAFQQYLKAHDYPIQGNIDYGALLNSLRARCSATPFEPMFAFVAINPAHEGQKKFTNFLGQKGFLLDEADFRDAYVLPNRASDYQRLSARLTYVIGLLASKHPDIVVVSDAFDIYFPLVDYVQNRGGKVTLAFFRRGLEERWQRTGIFDCQSPVKFVDLGPDAKQIIGADLSTASPHDPTAAGLSGFKF